MNKSSIFVLIASVIGMLACSNLFGPEYDLSAFNSITETDESGHLIGNIDKRDWSAESYENVYFGSGYWCSPYKYISLLADSTTMNASKTIRIYNASSGQIDFSINIDPPFSCNPQYLQLFAATLSNYSIQFTLPQLIDTEYRDSLLITSSTDETLKIPLYGKLKAEDDWLVVMPPIRNTQMNPAHPNPCSQQTQIRFSLQEQNKVKIYVVNKDGEKIKSLIDARLAAGNHFITWDVSSLKDGLYRVFFETGDREKYGDVRVIH